MGVATRKFNRHIKTLMHFDYPYFAEPGDGLRDEIGVLSWEKAGNAKLVGVEIPVAENVPGTPKFGYRCLQTSAGSDYIESAVNNNYLDIKTAKHYEIEFFIRKTNAAAGNIVNFLNGEDSSLFTISTNANNYIVLTSEAMSIAGATSTAALTLNTWDYVKVRINEGHVYIYVNGVLSYTGLCELQVEGVSKIRLGGFIGQLDEFLIRDSISGDNVPGVPNQGYIDTYGIGGTGKQGDLNLTSGTNYINSGNTVSSFESPTKFTVSGLWAGGMHGIPSEGDEVFIVLRDAKDSSSLEAHPDIGKYALKTIKSRTGSTFELTEPITEFPVSSDLFTKYNVYVMSVPNYTSVLIDTNATVQPYSIGYVLFRSKGDVRINGKILTSGIATPWRKDLFQMTHNHLLERFIINLGGGVMILSEGTVTAGDNARIGAVHSGAGKAGQPVYGRNQRGVEGGSGYGSSGGTPDKNGVPSTLASGAGGVGGGGSGAGYQWEYTGNGFPAGYLGATGGGYYGAGGTQGKVVGSNSSGWYSCGGGALGSGGSLSNGRYTIPGSCVLIICKKIAISMNAISTGGCVTPWNNSAQGLGGAGCGMCYLAYEEAI